MNLFSVSQPRAALSPFWLASWSIALACGWLLPNHYLPWSSFHTDAWISILVAVAAAGIVVGARPPFPLHGVALVALGASAIPFIQYAAGLIFLSGTAWVSSAYLLGFALALVFGAVWEKSRADALLNGLFLGFGVAALVSVGLQLHQWLYLDLLGVWSIQNSGRPFANLAQPNQLGTLILWAVLGLGWAYVKKQLGGLTASILAAFLLWGLALTTSRTAWIGVLILLAAAWFWRSEWRSSKAPWVVTGLAFFFFICTYVQPRLAEALLIGAPSSASDVVLRLSGEQRPQVWSLFAQAALHQPLFGFGWDQVVLAQLEMAPQYPSLTMRFAHAHNIFLDLVLWCGLPLGLLLSGYLAILMFKMFRRIKRVEDALPFLVVIVIGNHAMLELPLHYAYFLLPTGLVLGALQVRLGFAPVLSVGRVPVIMGFLLGCLLFAAIVRDYFHLEPRFQQLRYEWANIRVDRNAPFQPMTVLNQWEEFLWLSRFEPRAGMAPQELEWMRKITMLYPTALNTHKLMAAFAWNGRPDEARWWQARACKTVTPTQCEIFKRAWLRQAETDSRIAAVGWPD